MTGPKLTPWVVLTRFIKYIKETWFGDIELFKIYSSRKIILIMTLCTVFSLYIHINVLLDVVELNKQIVEIEREKQQAYLSQQQSLKRLARVVRQNEQLGGDLRVKLPDDTLYDERY